jgi:hypothetical protein
VASASHASELDRARLAAPVLAARAKRARRAALEGLAAGVALSVALALVAVALGGRIVLPFWASVAAFVVGFGRFRHVGLVVWLRKFRPERANRIRFHRALGSASLGLLCPVTIQDASFSVSYLSAFHRRLVLAPVGIVLFGAGTLALAFPAYALTHSTALVAVIVIIWYVAFWFGVYRFVRRAGFTALRGGDGRAKADARLRALRAGRALPWVGVEVLRCEDELWKDVVDDALHQARVAIIDVTEPSEHIYWELRQALEHLGEAHVIPVAEAGADLTHVTEAAPDIDATWLDRNLVTYPAKQAFPGPARAAQIRKLHKQLRLELAARLA